MLMLLPAAGIRPTCIVARALRPETPRELEPGVPAMDLYSVALLLHFLAIMGGVAASTLSHLALLRLERSTTSTEARQWLRLGGGASKAFPVVLLTFIGSGGYMAAQRWGWSASFVSVGMLAVVTLLVNGMMMAKRARALAMLLAREGDEPSADARRMMHDPIIATLPWVNTSVVTATVALMVIKPATGPSLATIAVAVAGGLLLARRLSPRRALSVAKGMAA